jgi:hypothetical protein
MKWLRSRAVTKKKSGWVVENLKTVEKIIRLLIKSGKVIEYFKNIRQRHQSFSKSPSGLPVIFPKHLTWCTIQDGD